MAWIYLTEDSVRAGGCEAGLCENNAAVRRGGTRGAWLASFVTRVVNAVWVTLGAARRIYFSGLWYAFAKPSGSAFESES